MEVKLFMKKDCRMLKTIEATIIYSMVLMVFSCKSAQSENISDVLFRGSSVCFGMRVEKSYLSEDAFLVVTSGARFEYVPGKLKIYQGLDENKRLLATMSFDSNAIFQKAESNDDHTIFTSDTFNMGIYADSTLILSPHEILSVTCEGAFMPDYRDRIDGEMILIDEKGGLEILPQQGGPGYKFKNLTFAKNGWTAQYTLYPTQRVMIAAFPPRVFNFKQANDLQIVHTAGAADFKNDMSLGYLPPDNVIQAWSKYASVITIQGSGLYSGHGDIKKSGYRYPERTPGKWNFGGPYVPLMPNELRRVIRTAHSCGMKVLPYTSVFFHYAAPDADAYFNDVKQMVDTYRPNGIYIDEMYMDKQFEGGRVLDDKIANWELMRRLRELVGPDGIIYYHGSGGRDALSAVPNIDALADTVLYAEGVPFNSFDDLYIKYKVRKYGISNTIGMIKADKKPDRISMTQVVEVMLKMNNRMRWLAYPVLDNTGRCIWPTNPPSDMIFYYKKIAELKKLQN